MKRGAAVKGKRDGFLFAAALFGKKHIDKILYVTYNTNIEKTHRVKVFKVKKERLYLE